MWARACVPVELAVVSHGFVYESRFKGAPPPKVILQTLSWTLKQGDPCQPLVVTSTMGQTRHIAAEWPKSLALIRLVRCLVRKRVLAMPVVGTVGSLEHQKGRGGGQAKVSGNAQKCPHKHATGECTSAGPIANWKAAARIMISREGTKPPSSEGTGLLESAGALKEPAKALGAPPLAPALTS